MKRVDERWVPYLALVPPFVALGVQLALWSVIAPFSWFLFFPAVFVSSWIGGLRPGLAATALSATVAWYFFVEPRYVLFKGQPNTLLTLSVFIVMGVLFSLFHERLRRANVRTEAALAESRLSNEALVAANQRVVDLLERTRELDAVKTEFFANISHELRTPLTLIMLPLERLLAAMPAEDPHRSELGSALRNSQVLLSHVNNLLDAAKLEAGGLELHYSETELARLVRMTAAFFESRALDRDVALRVVAPESLRAQVDPAQVRRILLNLLANAFAFTPSGGTIRVELRPRDGEVELVVADSGPGVPEAERERIFDRFQQGGREAGRSSPGTGLGLSIVRELVTLHGGAVEAGAAPEGGALFRVSLPATAPAEVTVGDAQALAWDDVVVPPETPQRPAVPVGTDPGSAELPVVLVVEDNVDLNELITLTLSGDYRVVSAFDGREGLELARSHRPDVIVTDLMMPVLSGAELVDLVRADRSLATTAILVVSARADEAGRLRLLDAGANDYLVKPFNIPELKLRIANLVALHRAESALRGEAVRDATARLQAADAERRLREAEQRAGRALDINDHVIQGLSSAAYAIERGDLVTAGRAVSTTLDAARKVIADLAPQGRAARPGPENVVTPASVPVAPVGSAGPLRVVIADDMADIRTALRSVLEALTDVEVVGEAADGREAVDLVAASRPDLVLLDLSMPVMSGLDALARIRVEAPATKVVVLSGFGRDQAAGDALSLGAVAYVEKGGSSRRLLTLIEDLFPGRVRSTATRPAPAPKPEEKTPEVVTDSALDLVSVYLHELKNPLAVATGIAELLAEQPAGEAAGPDLVPTLERSLRRMSRLVDSLAEANRLGSGNLSLAVEPVDLVAVARTTIADLAHVLRDRPVELIAAEPAVAPADPFRIRQVLENLISNAVKFSPAGSAIQVRVEQRPSWVQVSVTDQGVGVPEDKQPLLFQKFERLGSDVPGIGLGLFLSQEIARAHQGELSYRGEPSTFMLTLPRLQVDPSDPPNALAGAVPSGPGSD